MAKEYKYTRFFKAISNDDVPRVGGKNASPGEMYRELAPQGIKIPHGFAITVAGCRCLLDKANAWPVLHTTLDNIDPSNVADLARRSGEARAIVYGAPIPESVLADAHFNYFPSRTGLQSVELRSFDKETHYLTKLTVY